VTAHIPPTCKLTRVTVIRPAQDAHFSTARDFTAMLRNCGVHVTELKTPITDPVSSPELVVSVGGDSTLLSVARHLFEVRAPVIALRKESKDRIATVTPEALLSELSNPPISRWCRQVRMGLSIQVDSEGGDHSTYVALSHIALNQGVMKHPTDVSLWVDGQFAIRYRAAGLMLASPTGTVTTAGAFGGPLLTPTHRALTILPVAPQRLTDRALVLEGRAVVTVCVEHVGGDLALLLDGGEVRSLTAGDRVSVSAMPDALTLLLPATTDQVRGLRTPAELVNPFQGDTCVQVS